GARALVADRPGEGDRRLAHRRPQRGVERGGGRLLEHLLVATLDRALALAEGDDRPVPVGEELDLDVARPLDVALAEHRAVAECRLGLAAGRLERLLELLGATHDAHAAAATPRRRLDEEREAERSRLARLDDRYARLVGDPLRLELVARRAQRGRGRAGEVEP